MLVNERASDHAPNHVHDLAIHHSCKENIYVYELHARKQAFPPYAKVRVQCDTQIELEQMRMTRFISHSRSVCRALLFKMKTF